MSSVHAHAGPLYDHMAPHMWQLCQYSCKLLSSCVSPLKLGVRIFGAWLNFIPFEPHSEISIQVQSHTRWFHLQQLFVAKTQFLSFRNESNASDAVLYDVLFVWETVMSGTQTLQPFSSSDIQLKCGVRIVIFGIPETALISRTIICSDAQLIFS